MRKIYIILSLLVIGLAIGGIMYWLSPNTLITTGGATSYPSLELPSNAPVNIPFEVKSC